MTLLADAEGHPVAYAVVVARGCHGAGAYRPRRVYATAAEALASIAKNKRERVISIGGEWEIPSCNLTRADAHWSGADLDTIPSVPNHPR